MIFWHDGSCLLRDESSHDVACKSFLLHILSNAYSIMSIKVGVKSSGYFDPCSLLILLDHSRTAIEICLGMLKCSKNVENSQI